MKVGILTYHDGINYGAFFQVFALQTSLEHLGAEVSIINYKNPGFTVREYRCFLNREAYLRGELFNNLFRILKFRAIQRRHLHLTRRVFAEAQVNRLQFDRVLIGSDEVWNCSSSLIGQDPVYFSRALNAGRISSYAASFGALTDAAAVSEDLRADLCQLADIAVRDENSVRMVAEICNRQAELVLDPAFLVDFTPQAVLPAENDYVLVYGGFDKVMAGQILEYKKQTGCRLVSVGFRNSWCDVNLTTINPFEWLGYFVKADRIITTMYHGMIFSILNRKDFVMFGSPYRLHKIGNLMVNLGVDNRLVDQDRTLAEVMNARFIDYVEVAAKLAPRREGSLKFLKRAMGV